MISSTSANAAGKVLAENDNIGPDNRNARVFLTPTETAAYRIVASSYQEPGMGTYTLRIREFIPGKTK